jgi:hypothetical protein
MMQPNPLNRHLVSVHGCLPEKSPLTGLNVTARNEERAKWVTQEMAHPNEDPNNHLNKHPNKQLNIAISSEFSTEIREY